MAEGQAHDQTVRVWCDNKPSHNEKRQPQFTSNQLDTGVSRVRVLRGQPPAVTGLRRSEREAHMQTEPFRDFERQSVRAASVRAVSPMAALRRLLGRVVDDWIDSIAACPWQGHAGAHLVTQRVSAKDMQRRALYTPQEREKRDKTVWTLVQGILAPLQFVVFGVSLYLVLHYLQTGAGYEIATASIVAKTVILYAIMITGAIWEKEVFGQYLFAPSFFWEDVVSMLVMALQTLYLLALMFGWWSPTEQILIAIAAYAAYVINAAQFVLKLRQARLEGETRGVRSQGAQSRGHVPGRPA